MKILALRGLIEVADKGGSPAQQVKRLQQAAPLIERIDEKRLLVSKLKNVRAIEATRMLKTYFTDNEVKKEAMHAAVDQVWHFHRDRRLKDEMIAVLKAIAEGTDDNRVRDRANQRIKELQK